MKEEQNEPRKVLIFRNEMLPCSETFVLAQAMALRRFEPFFAGVHAAPKSLLLPSKPILVSPRATLAGKLQRRVFWRTSLAPKFYKALRALKPTLIHAHFALDGAAALPLHAKLRVPLVVTLHGYDVSISDATLRASPEGRLYLRRRTELWSSASAFLCISEFIREKALAKGFPQAKLRVHYTGTDLSHFQPEACQPDRNLILFVGRLVEKKGCHKLLDALKIISGSRPAAHVVFIGDGPLTSSLKARVAAEGLQCEFLGMQPASVVKTMMSKARIFCVPSMKAASGDSEGLGMVFGEAQAMGLPVVSFKHGGIPEIVKHERNGLLGPEGDSHALALNLHRLLDDDDLRNRYSTQGMKDVRECFDITSQTAKLEDLYFEILTKAR